MAPLPSERRPLLAKRPESKHVLYNDKSHKVTLSQRSSLQSGHLFYRCLVVWNATPGQLPLSLPRDPPKVQTRSETKRAGMFSFTESCPCSCSKAPQFGSNNAQPFNKSFNKAVHLTFYCRSRPRRTAGRRKKTKQRCKLRNLSNCFCLPAGCMFFCERKQQLDLVWRIWACEWCLQAKDFMGICFPVGGS